MRLENWSIGLAGTMSMYGSLENIPQVAYGSVYGNPRFEDGTSVRTSKIQEINLDSGYIQTRNSRYELGVIDSRYLEHCRNEKRENLQLLEKFINKENGK
jgi:hypothetical protein